MAVDLAYMFENGDLSDFTSVEAKSASVQAVVGTSHIRAGWNTKSCRTLCRPGDFWPGNNSIRCLMVRGNSGETGGMGVRAYGTNYYAESGAQQLTNNMLLWELHHPASLYSISGLDVAPHAILFHNGDLVYRIFTGNGAASGPYPIQEVHTLLSPFTYDQSVDLKWEIDFTTANTGYVKVWIDPTGEGSFTQVLNRTGIPTIPFSTAHGITNVTLYTEYGLYYSSGANVNLPDADSIIHNGVRRATAMADIDAFFHATAPPPTPPPVVIAPATGTLDAFTRANNPSLGSGWQANFFAEGAVSPSISGNGMSVPYGTSAWWTIPYGPNSEFFATLTSAHTKLLLGVRGQNPGSFNASGYALQADWLAQTVSLVRIDSRAFTTLATVSVPVASGHQYWVQAIGTSLTGYRNTGSGWSSVVTATDTKYQSVGYGFVGSR